MIKKKHKRREKEEKKKQKENKKKMSPQFVCCVKCDLGVNPDQCRLISTTFFSPWFVSGKCPFPPFSPYLTMSLKHFLMFYYPLLKKCSLKNNPYFLTKSFFSLFSPCSSPLVYSPCRYSSFSLCFSMLPLLLFALFMFIDSLLCFFCLCLFLFFEKNWIYIIYFSFCWKSLNFELVISLCKTLLVLSFFLFRPFFCLFFTMVFFRTRSSLPFFGRKNHLSNKSLQEFLFRFSVIGYFFKSSIIMSLFKKIWIVWSPFFFVFSEKILKKHVLPQKLLLEQKHFCPDLILW